MPDRQERQMDCKKIAFVVVLFIAGQPGCSAERVPEAVTGDESEVVKGNNEFATDLYARLSSSQPGNLFFSPYSVSSALAVAYAGANGETAAQMAKVLHFPAPATRLHPEFQSLREKMAPGEGAEFQLRVANRLWAQEGFDFLPEFLRVAKANYGAEPGLLDFRQTEVARKTINAWIEEQTDGKIQDLLGQGFIDPNTRLVLTNAIYFKAPWTFPFGERATSDAPFHISASEQVDVPMMHQTERFAYGASDDVQVLAMPYGRDFSLSMVVLLPSKTDGLAGLEKRLTRTLLKKLFAATKEQKVIVHLPRFKMTSEFRLADVLASMGMPLAFSGQADFSGMSTQERLFISAVVHKTVVDVNEKGTEAAAATDFGGFSRYERPEQPVEFRADHPFVFLIWDGRTKSILFLGRLVNPQD
jgi:serpin B